MVLPLSAWLSRIFEKKNYYLASVSVGIDTATEFSNEHAKGYNTIAEMAGIDPNLKNEVVMVGGHLDSWVGRIWARKTMVLGLLLPWKQCAS